jgi:hypothetical protein
MLNRRNLILGATAFASAAGLWWIYDTSEARGRFEIERTDAEWRGLLTRAQFDVLRLHRTEVPGSSPLNHEKRTGVYACAGCALPLFSSETKYDSRTGWPSFYQPRQRDRHRAGLCAPDPAHRGALPTLRRTSRPRVRRRTAADRAALLHERHCDDVHAVAGGLGRHRCRDGGSRREMAAAAAIERERPIFRGPSKPIFTVPCAGCRLPVQGACWWTGRLALPISWGG